MNKSEYTSYQEAFNEGTRGMHQLSAGAYEACPDCPEYDEAHFSWSRCETCQRSLGGDRYAAHFNDEDGKTYHISICPDCVYYATYGQLDDQAMLEISAS